jgi:hypothetical protein
MVSFNFYALPSGLAILWVCYTIWMYTTTVHNHTVWERAVRKISKGKEMQRGEWKENKSCIEKKKGYLTLKKMWSTTASFS